MSGITKRSWVVLERMNVKFCGEIEALFVERDRYRDALSNLANAAAIFKGNADTWPYAKGATNASRALLEMELANAEKLLGATGSFQRAPLAPLPVDERGDEAAACKHVVTYERPVCQVQESWEDYAKRLDEYINWMQWLAPSPKKQFHPGQAT